MILGFKIQFKQPILNRTKIHTIRVDKNNRWSMGRKIHFTINVRTKNQEVFEVRRCESTQKIKIEYLNNWITVYIEGKLLSEKEIKQLALNDGFETMKDFRKWFNKDFDGKIIHWTDLRY